MVEWRPFEWPPLRRPFSAFCHFGMVPGVPLAFHSGLWFRRTSGASKHGTLTRYSEERDELRGKLRTYPAFLVLEVNEGI